MVKDLLARNRGGLVRKLTALLVAFAFLSSTIPVEARTRKGDKLLKEGKAVELRGDFDAALEFFEQAVDQDPGDVGYLLALRRVRFAAGQRHVDLGQKLREAGKLEEASAEFQKALVADPSSAIALQEMRRIQDLLNAAPRSGVTPEDRGLTAADRARRDSDDKVDSMMELPAIKPTTSLIPTLKINNQPPKVLFETVGRLAGINIIFDPQFNPAARNFNVDLMNTGVDQAFDYVALLTHTYWKPITENAIFVTDDNVTKRRDYEDHVVKVFYITNATSVQEFQEIATAIRTVAEIRRVFTYNAQRAMVVRDTADKVALAEKLVHDLDKPKSEVVVDIIVMEANSQRTRDLAATIATAGVAGINMPINFNPAGVTSGTPSTQIRLGDIGRTLSLNQFTTSLPGGLLKALLTDTRTKVLNNPQVRASDGQKVTLKIGNRIPYATGSFQTNTAAALVSTQFNYADVGVNVDMTPQVHSSDEVTLHVEVTISSVTQRITIGGIEQPVIGQRSNIADLRLHEGEVNILGGLSQSQDSQTINGIPGLVNIPILGHFLFGSQNVDKVQGDLLIALIPHIVRTPNYTAENLRGIYAGTDQVVKINYAPKTGAIPLAGSAVVPVAVAVQTAPLPGTVPPTPAAPVSLFPSLAQVGRVAFQPAAVQTTVGATVSVNLQGENLNNLGSAMPIRVKYDPAKLRLNDVNAGEIFSRAGVTATTSKDIRNDTGEATITIARPPGAAGITGAGAIAVLNFTAIAAGQSTVTLSQMALMDPSGQAVAATAGAMTINVQ